MPSQTEIQESITARIIEGLQNGLVPWKKPWRNDPNCGPAANIVSHRNYSGINPILLDLAAQANGFVSRYPNELDRSHFDLERETSNELYRYRWPPVEQLRLTYTLVRPLLLEM